MEIPLSDEGLAYLRLLVGDTHPDPDKQLFTDTDISSIAAHEPSAKMTAAALLDLAAGSELLLSKKIQSQDLSTDGPAVAKELRAMAAELRRQHTADADTEGWDMAVFTFTEQHLCDPEATEHRWTR